MPRSDRHDNADRLPNKSYGGMQGVYKHASRETRTDMTFSVYVPAAPGRRKAAGGLVSVGIDLHPRQRHRERRIPQRLRRTRTDLRRAGHQPARRTTCRAIPRTPMISGLAPASMSTRRKSRLRATTACGAMSRKSCRSSSPKTFRSMRKRQSILGHSMGGHGALTVALRHPDRYRAASAFAPIVAPSQRAVGHQGAGRLSRQRQAAWRNA